MEGGSSVEGQEEMMNKLPVGIIGSGNIGTDLMYKVLRNTNMELRLLAGIDPASEGLALGRKLGVPTSTNSIDAILDEEDIELVFDATGARQHTAHAPRLKEAGKIAVDLTPAAVGPHVVPAINLDEHLGEANVNLISCAAQATVPIVSAVSRITPVGYAEVTSAASGRSVGPATRQHIDKALHTTERALVAIAGAKDAKARGIIDTTEPPIIMRNSIRAEVDDKADESAIKRSILHMVDTVQGYVPGYQLELEPTLNGGFLVTVVEVRGAGDYLPSYAGNLDIMTAAAVAVGERYAFSLRTRATA
jgi:acetaldehyde dehydrogenase